MGSCQRLAVFHSPHFPPCHRIRPFLPVTLSNSALWKRSAAPTYYLRPALSAPLSLSLPHNLRNSRGIDWRSQPLISPPPSYLLFSQTLTPRWYPGGLRGAASSAHMHEADIRCRCIITSQHKNTHSSAHTQQHTQCKLMHY